MTKESERQSSGSEVVIRSEDLQKEGHPKGNTLSLFSVNTLKSAINKAVNNQLSK